MRRGIGDKGTNAFAHIKSRQHKARQLKSLQDVVLWELGATHMVQNLPDTGYIVPTPVH